MEQVLKLLQLLIKLLPLVQVSLEGYNTLDALASVAFSVIAVQTLKQLGFSSKKEYISTIWVVGIVVALAFSASLHRFRVSLEIIFQYQLKR